MVDHNKNRQKLLDGAIKTVAECGLEGFTTRSVEQYSGLKDSYIYRYFEDKDDLLKKAFIREDEIFIKVIEHYFSIVHEGKCEFRECCYLLWQQCWRYLISNLDACKFYVRYYYSAYFTKEAFEEHLAICNNLISKVKKVLPLDVNATILLQQLLETVLSGVMKVALGESDDSEECSKAMFDFCYSVIEAYISCNNSDNEKIKEQDNMSYLKFYSIVKSWN